VEWESQTVTDLNKWIKKRRLAQCVGAVTSRGKAHLRYPVTHWWWHVFHLACHATQQLKRAAPLSMLQVSGLQTVVRGLLSVPFDCGLWWTEGEHPPCHIFNIFRVVKVICRPQTALFGLMSVKMNTHAIYWQCKVAISGF